MSEVRPMDYLCSANSESLGCCATSDQVGRVSYHILGRPGGDGWWWLLVLSLIPGCCAVPFAERPAERIGDGQGRISCFVAIRAFTLSITRIACPVSDRIE